MKIAKYIFLLIVLVAIALTVYVATLKGDYLVERSKTVPVSKKIIYDYVNNYKNWEDWDFITDKGSNIQYTYSDTTAGNGAYISWKNNTEEGRLETIFAKEADSLAQKKTVSGETSFQYWSFKDTDQGTKITWYTKGELGFVAKFKNLLEGGTQKSVGKDYDKSLAGLTKIILEQINTFDIKVEGITNRNGGFYLQQQAICKIPELTDNVTAMTTAIFSFFRNNTITMTGPPFTVYKNYNTTTGTVDFAVAMPIAEEIFTTPGSDYTCGKLEPGTYLKTVLHGHYSHSKHAWDKAMAYITTNNLIQNTALSNLEVYVKGPAETKNAAEWITELYIPIGPVAAPMENGAVTSSATATPTTPISGTMPTTVPKPKVAKQKAPVTKPTTTTTEVFNDPDQ